MIRKEVKAQMIAGIDKKELVFLKFLKETAEDELEWEHSKEFEYHGNMYDVIEKEIAGDSVFYWCWWDNEETTLNRQLNDLVNQAIGNSSQHKGHEQQFSKLFKTLFYKDLHSVEAPYFSFVKKTAFTYLITYPSRFKVPPVPPPEIV